MGIEDYLSEAKKAGAETQLEIGIFLIAGAVGGLIDAAFNPFSSGDPWTVATLVGGGAVGLKKAWDARRQAEKDSHTDERE